MADAAMPGAAPTDAAMPDTAPTDAAMPDAAPTDAVRTDADLLDRFERAALERRHFTHENHVRVAWLYLNQHPVPTVLARYSAGLKRLTERLGVPHLYHETITYAYIFLINERIQRGSTRGDRSWRAFVDANPDLFERKHAALLRHYDRAQLDTDVAREVFVLPAAAPGV